MKEGNEECDDGNSDSCDGCSADCVIEFCGDAVQCPDEDRELGVACPGGEDCNPDCTCNGGGVSCGDSGPECDGSCAEGEKCLEIFGVGCECGPE